MKRTTNYSLPTWGKTDFIPMDGFNDLTQKTDSALASHAASHAEKATASASQNLGTHGRNARIAVGSYTGKGTYGQSNAVSIACDFYPVVLLVAPLDDSPVKNPRTSGTIRPEGGTNFNLAVVWKDAGISWYNTSASNAHQQLNNDESYCYVVPGYDKVKGNS